VDRSTSKKKFSPKRKLRLALCLIFHQKIWLGMLIKKTCKSEYLTKQT